MITGPNTGGKTVTLKNSRTLHVNGTSRIANTSSRWFGNGCFYQVYADIGDEQSIEQSLSTFSSHMVNIVEILKQVDLEVLFYLMN